MRILLTNDDGIHAPGFAVLERIAATLSDDVWAVAPAEEQSGAGHSLTLTRPVRLQIAELLFDCPITLSHLSCVEIIQGQRLLKGEDMLRPIVARQRLRDLRFELAADHDHFTLLLTGDPKDAVSDLTADGTAVARSALPYSVRSKKRYWSVTIAVVTPRIARY